MEKEKGFYYGAASADPSKTSVESRFISDSLLNSGNYYHKSDLEFSRYKQDCRKRALDAAQSEHNEWARKNDGKLVQMGTEPDIIALADKYYNWLISIPDTK